MYIPNCSDGADLGLVFCYHLRDAKLAAIGNPNVHGIAQQAVT
jgi:hypothetical protein